MVSDTKVEPDSIDAHYVLATFLARDSLLAEAEEIATKAVELLYTDRPYDTRAYFPGFVYRLRSKIRAQRGNYIEALADIKIAQEYTIKYWPDDLETEADLWKQLGFASKAELVALEAYRKGSLSAESFVKDLYVLRTESDNGFGDYFLARLTDGDESTGSAAPELTQAPNFQLQTLEGQTVDLASLRGQVVVLNFWFTTCGPCVGEIPALNQLAKEYKDQAMFLALATDSPERLREFLKEHPFEYKIIPRAGEVAKAYKVEGYPSHFIVDREGRIAWSARGAAPGNIERLRKMIQRIQ